MVRYGLTLSSEENPPSRMVDLAAAAKAAGFDFVSVSDQFHPWIEAQGHSPFVWGVLGAISERTAEIDVAVGVSCPIMRVHPVISAHAAATAAALLEGRFTWGLGTGEALNEHVLGQPWPPAEVRLEMLVEAVEVIRKLWTGESVTHRGAHFTVEDARIFDLPERLPPLVISAFGSSAIEQAAEIGDGLWVTGIEPEAIDAYRAAGGDGPVYTQLSLCWNEDEEEAAEIALRLWPNTALPGQLAQDLRTVLHFEQAVELVRQDDLGLPIGPDPDRILESIAEAEKSGADHIYLHQIGNPLEGFIEFWENELRPELSRS